MPVTEAPPYNANAERTVIGCLLLDPDTAHSVIGALQPEDFYDSVYRQIFTTIGELYESGTAIDIVTVSDKLQGNVTIEKSGGSAFLAELPVEVPTSSHVEHYAEIIKSRSTRRQLLKLGKDMASLAAAEGKSTSELIETAEQSLLQLDYTATQIKPVALGSLCSDRFDHYTAVYESDDAAEHFGIRTGYQELDDMIVGLRPGDMMVLGGRPSMGKTAIALDIARHVVTEQQKAVTIFSLEMSKEQLFDRVFAAFHQIDEYRLSRGQLQEAEFTAMGQTFDSINKLPLYLDDDPNKSITNLRSKARRHKMEHGIDLLIIDYMQLVQVPSHVSRDNRTEQLRYISENIKALAREIDAPIIALSQLNREAEKRIDKRPLLSDLRESGAIEQDADFAVLLYREGYYNEDCEHPEITDLYLRKNRPHGQTGQVELRFNPKTYRFASS